MKTESQVPIAHSVINPNEPAFLSLQETEEWVDGLNTHLKSLAPMGGLTKREYFTAMAMQGLCSRRERYVPALDARIAVEWADALIAALNKLPDTTSSITNPEGKV